MQTGVKFFTTDQAVSLDEARKTVRNLEEVIYNLRPWKMRRLKCPKNECSCSTLPRPKMAASKRLLTMPSQFIPLIRKKSL